MTTPAQPGPPSEPAAQPTQVPQTTPSPQTAPQFTPPSPSQTAAPQFPPPPPSPAPAPAQQHRSEVDGVTASEVLPQSPLPSSPQEFSPGVQSPVPHQQPSPEVGGVPPVANTGAGAASGGQGAQAAGSGRAAAGRRRQVVILLALVGLLGLLLGMAWYFNRDAATNANVGDCLHDPGDQKLKIVKCGGADADYTVLGKVSGKDQREAISPFSSVCRQWPDSTNSYWQGEEGRKGDVLCLRKR
ncbi:hypothetical protein Dvina_34425 [Dactylosporangium vinaceum]|uniref:Serine/threonine protein kinase n=1 Tax=Dactylosporangium vinaceum TaxID=53362 RepID=A0ABV5MM51_9ACTN|nr:hypothetical protein [Dactylosporangium vinaceum]UAB93338.1 hypothetical protein Dvina_34425 [Dactylosporangium vinaceum]